MTEEPPEPPGTAGQPGSQETSTQEDADLEREVRSQRKFSIAEAIGRQNADLLKGASPVTLKRQAELQIEHYLESALEDPEGALQVVLLRRVRESALLLESGYEAPLAALAGAVERLLGSEPRLQRFVTAIDAEWGRIYSERPYFEGQGRTPDRRDPYTIASVRATLASLVAELDSGGED